MSYQNARSELTVTSRPGLPESTYEQCLAQELNKNGIAFQLQHARGRGEDPITDQLQRAHIWKVGIKRFVL